MQCAGGATARRAKRWRVRAWCEVCHHAAQPTALQRKRANPCKTRRQTQITAFSLIHPVSPTVRLRHCPHCFTAILPRALCSASENVRRTESRVRRTRRRRNGWLWRSCFFESIFTHSTKSPPTITLDNSPSVVQSTDQNQHHGRHPAGCAHAA